MNIIPTIIEKKFNGECAYDLYSRMLKDRIIFITGEINDTSSNLVISELLYLDSINNDEICIYINSPGGSVTAGMAIVDTMNFIKSEITTIVVGIAASMASIILANGTKGKRCALENSEVMIHQPLGGVNGQATEIKIAAERILKTKDKLNKILCAKTNKTLKQIEKDSERDFYMSSKEALGYGIIDKILN